MPAYTPDAFKEQFAEVLAQINVLSEGGTKSLVTGQLKNMLSIEKETARAVAGQENTKNLKLDRTAFPREEAAIVAQKQPATLAETQQKNQKLSDTNIFKPHR